MAKIYKIALIFLFLGMLPVAADAATLYFSPSSGSYTVGSTLSTSVYVSSADQAMNAASGVISFPQDKLEVTSLSKSGSIFTLWVQEPSFLNSVGTINFEGIVLNPGFSGATGKILTANFKVKVAGVATLNFSSGSVLANDGKGTNILTSLGNVQFSLGGAGPTVPEATTPSAVSGAPSAPQIFSLTHPDPNKWYAKKDAKFTWSISSDVTGVRLLVGIIPAAIPTVTYVPAINEKEVTNLGDGIWYFHVQLRNASGWGEVSHFRFQIDTEPPASFEIKFIDGKETTNPRPTVIFDTTDSISGIEYYKVKIGEEDFFALSSEIVQGNPYTFPLQAPGKRTILVQAFDKAGNYTTAVEEFVILPIETPVITDYPQTLLPGTTLLIKGTVAPEAKVKVYIQKDEKETRTEEIKSDQEGKWSYIGTESLEKGIYKIWAEAINSLGAKSELSEKITIQVNPPAFIRIGSLVIDYLTTIVTLLILISVIVFGIIWSWQKIKQRRKRLRKEIAEADKALYQAFKALREETKEQIAKLDGEPGLNEREKKICDDLKKALKISEKFIGKEIKDIEKELD
jgi:hypothetical protein